MPHTQSYTPTEARYNALKMKKMTLEKEIDDLQQCPSADDILKGLKRAKLKVKEEMELIRYAANSSTVS